MGTVAAASTAKSSHRSGKAKKSEVPTDPPDGAKAGAKAEDGAGDEASGGKPKYNAQAGPKKIDVGHDIEIDLPEGFLYLDREQSLRFMEEHGNFHNESLLGVIGSDSGSWIVTIRYTEDGYVKDDEADKLDADEILNAIREGTEEENKERERRGFKALHVSGWSEPPRYVRERHQLVWGIRAKNDGEEEDGINYNTRVLGRKGYASINLIDAASKIETSKPYVNKLLAVTDFKRGSRYADFDSKTDKVAEYGLAALVVGGAGAAALKLVKVGLLAKFGGKLIALLIAFKKAFVLGLLAVGAFLRRLFGGRKKDAAAAAPAAAPASAGLQQHPTEGGRSGEPGA